MSKLQIKLLRGATAVAFALTLLTLPVAAFAAVDIDPGTTASDLAADGGTVVEECDDTETETCTVVTNEADNEVGALAEVTGEGAAVAIGEVFTDFNVTGDGGALVGSYMSAIVTVSGALTALGIDSLASVTASLEVKDTAADVVIAAETVVNDRAVEGKVPVGVKNSVAMSLPLVSGRSYRVSLILETRAIGGADEDAIALSDFLDTASWFDLSVTAGVDPFALIVIIDARLDQLEADVDALEEKVDGIDEDLGELEEKVDGIEEDLGELEETVEELREDFDSHSHTYLTGRGQGHNNTEADTGAPVVPESPEGEPGDGPDESASADDLCPGTPDGAEVDANGCDVAQFCALQERISMCSSSDWRDDESRNPQDCRWRRGACEAR